MITAEYIADLEARIRDLEGSVELMKGAMRGMRQKTDKAHDLATDHQKRLVILECRPDGPKVERPMFTNRKAPDWANGKPKRSWLQGIKDRMGGQDAD